MKLINWWVDRYSIGGLFFGSIICAAMSLLMICHIFFDFTLFDKLGRLSLEYKKGIAVPVKFNSMLDADTTFYAYQTMDAKPPLKANWSTVTKVDYETGTVYIKPDSFYTKGLLLAPQILFFVLLSFFCWQLAIFLHTIQKGETFILSNYLLLRNMGLSAIIYQVLLFAIYLLESSHFIKIGSRSTIPNFQSPISFIAEPDYSHGVPYFLGGCILLIVAKAFHKGYTLQQEQDLTV